MLLPNQTVAAPEQTKGSKPEKYKFTFKQRVALWAKSNSFRKILWSVLRGVLLLGLAFVILFPLVSKLSNSLKPAQEVFDSTVVFIPKNPTFDNYLTVIKQMDYFKVLAGTAFHSFYLAAAQAIICTLIAYGFARFKFPGRSLLFALVIVTVVVPPSAILFPLMVRFQYFGLNTLFWISPETINSGAHISLTTSEIPWPLILLSVTGVAFKNGLFIYLLRQYFKNVPKELEEAAFIDGAGYFRTFYKVMLPGAFPLMMTVFLFGFVWTYNDNTYWGALAGEVEVMSSSVQNVATRIVSAMQQGAAASSLTRMMEEVFKQAAVVLHILPLLILYIFTQRFFVQSIERSGLVG